MKDITPSCQLILLFFLSCFLQPSMGTLFCSLLIIVINIFLISIFKGTKFDVVRGIEGVNYTRTENDFDTSPAKEIKKTTYIPIKTTVVKGHRFEHHNKPTWCDMCEDFIWGLYTQAVRCQCKLPSLIISYLNPFRVYTMIIICLLYTSPSPRDS